MTAKDFSELGLGDVIEHVARKDIVVVMAHYGTRVTATRTFDVTNPEEWNIRLKAKHERPKEENEPEERIEGGS